MTYELMHKDIPVATLDIDGKGRIRRIVSVSSYEHFPFGTAPRRGDNNPSALIRWWDNRRIPMSRDDLRKVYGVALPEGASTHILLLHCHGLSLSDSYWIREEGSSTRFEDVNFFENDYSYDLGDALFGKKEAGETLNLVSPDATSEGNLKKRWKIIEGKRVLLKSGTPPMNYEVYNEVIASRVYDALGLEHVPYSLIREGDDVYCACPDFVDYSQDFVTAYMIYESSNKANDESMYSFFVRRYEELGIENAEIALWKMLLVDYLLGNEDRHLNNFGLLRDAKTLRFVGVAPCFDTGSCLGFNRTDAELAHLEEVPWKPFKTHAKRNQLSYIREVGWLNACALMTLPQLIDDVCHSFGNAIPDTRREAIVAFVTHRVEEVRKKYGLMPEGRHLELFDWYITDYGKRHGGIISNASILAEALNAKLITVMRHISRLTKLGYLRRVGAKKNGYWVVLH